MGNFRPAKMLPPPPLLTEIFLINFMLINGLEVPLPPAPSELQSVFFSGVAKFLQREREKKINPNLTLVNGKNLNNKVCFWN